MITFHGGPAQERRGLMLRRAPVFLRVTVDRTDGTIDALDLLDDTPSPSASVHVYRRRGEMQEVRFLDHGSEGWLVSAEYEYLADVDGELVRETERWRRWCRCRAAGVIV